MEKMNQFSYGPYMDLFVFMAVAAIISWGLWGMGIGASMVSDIILIISIGLTAIWTVLFIFGFKELK